MSNDNRCIRVAAVLGLMLAAGAASADTPAPSRAESIRQTLAGIEQRLRDHGGTWEKWGESLKEYRDDIRPYVTGGGYKWPWPAKDGYVFQGAAVQLHLRDELEDLPEGERPIESIVHFDRQLKALGIDLIVALIPSKLSIYPDYITAAGSDPPRPARAPHDRQVSVAVTRMMHTLLKQDVEVVDLHEAHRQFRLKHGDEVPLYYVRDGHFMNRGARLAAEQIAARLKRYDFVQKALAGENPYVGQKSSRSDGTKADPDLLLIRDKRTGRFYRDDDASPIVVAGDSHLLYNDGTAHVTGQIAREIGMAVCRITREGLAADIPLELARDRLLKQRRVVILLYTERVLAPRAGRTRWPVVNLPGATTRPAAGGPIRDLPATGVVVEASPPPDRQAPYPHYVMKFHLRQLADSDGRPIGSGEGVVHVLAMHNRAVLPVARTTTGERLAMNLTDWALVKERYRRVQTGSLPTAQVELDQPHFWGEVAGQPRLTDGQVGRLGEEDPPQKQAAPPATQP